MDIPKENSVSQQMSTMGNFPSCDVDEQYIDQNKVQNASPQKTYLLSNKNQKVSFVNKLNQNYHQKKPNIKKLISENISSEAASTVLDPTIREIPLTFSNVASSQVTRP